MAGEVTEYEGTAVTQVTIAVGEATSAEVDIGSVSVFAIQTPSAFDAATISFLAARNTGGTFTTIYDDAGVECKMTVATNESRMYSLKTVSDTLSPFRFIQLRCGDSSTPATVAAARTLYIIGKSG